MVLRRATESAAKINRSSSLDEGSLKNKLSIDRLSFPPKVCAAFLRAALVEAATLSLVVELPRPIILALGNYFCSKVSPGPDPGNPYPVPASFSPASARDARNPIKNDCFMGN